ncbi:MAG: prepilin-type N-terminal cleavage/methylation domain-containing protein, partial [Planctomycetaceae bacterium]|nr:prepilin-type N-terminal cleavage/methylation domain-containing protein [Planctomycetaceae bacterium]
MSRNRFYHLGYSVHQKPLCRKLLRQTLPHRSGLTLVEILVAVTLMIVIMLAVVQVFSYVGRTINKNQNAMIISGRLRA